MSPLRGIRAVVALAVTLALGVGCGGAKAASQAFAAPQKLLAHADGIKTSDHPEFLQLLAQAKQQRASLTPRQQWYLRYLIAWEAAYEGDFAAAGPLLQAVIDKSDDPVLTLRATATMVNILGLAHQYERAFIRLNSLLKQLPNVSDKAARSQALGETAQVLTDAGQYQLAEVYVGQMLSDLPDNESPCRALYFRAHARYMSGALQPHDDLVARTARTCTLARETVFANALYADIARVDMKRGNVADALVMLKDRYPGVLRDGYRAQVAEYEALLAKVYLMKNDLDSATAFAHKARKQSIEGEFSWPLTEAYRVLYLVQERLGHYKQALQWHEKFAAVDKGYINDVSAKAMAYQTVRQQVLAKKAEIEALNKQNRILQLRQQLDSKAAETSRLYIALLLTVLVSVALWMYRLKRSQLRFMHLARSDGLTGIFNRKHFLDEAARVVRYAHKSNRGACLILIDLDHFKQINDSLGHAVGDLVLKRAVEACRRHLRSVDVFGRLGGEEFGILLPECSLQTGRERADEIRSAIEGVAQAENIGPTLVSASFGVAATTSSGYDLRQLLIDADDALYQAKRGGRNQVVTACEAESAEA